MEATVAREERVGKARRRRKCAVNALGEHEKEKALHRELCGAAHRGGDLRAGEKVRERAGVAGEARAR